MKTRCCGLIIKDNKVLLIKRLRRGIEYYIAPGGTLEPNEQPVDCCIREIYEETNLKVNQIELFFEYDNFVYGAIDKEFYFLIKNYSGKTKLFANGTPEENAKISQVTDDGTFELVWVDLNEISDINLLPEILKEKIIDFNKK